MSEIHRIAGFPGDGTGPELYPQGVALFNAANQVLGRKLFEIVKQPYDAEYFLREGKAWPEGTAESLAREFRGAFVIAFGDNRVPRSGMAHAVDILLNGLRGNPNWNTNLNVRPTQVVHPDLASGIEKTNRSFELFALDENDVRIEEEVIDEGSDQEIVYPKEHHNIARFKAKLIEAARRAKELGETKIVAVHKNNVLKHSHGPWEEICKEVQASEGVEIQMALMDSFLAQLVQKPSTVPQVVVTDRAFGSVLSRVVPELNSEKGGVPANFNSVIGRENTEGMYFRKGSTSEEGGETIGTQIGKHSYKMVEANTRGNVELAKERGLNTFTVLHLEDVHPKSYGLWRKIADKVAEEEGVTVDFMHAGDFVALAATNPEALHNRVFAGDNILGDICGDAISPFVGGMGIPATLCENTTGETEKMYGEPLHGSGLDIAGKGIANPTATLLTVGEMFAELGLTDLRTHVSRALHAVISQGIKTPEVGGRSSTQEFGNAVIKEFLRTAER